MASPFTRYSILATISFASVNFPPFTNHSTRHLMAREEVDRAGEEARRGSGGHEEEVKEQGGKVGAAEAHEAGGEE